MMILSVDDLDNVPDGEEQSVINEILKMNSILVLHLRWGGAH